MKILFINPIVLYSGKELNPSSVNMLSLLLKTMPEVRVVLVSVESMDAVNGLRDLVEEDVRHQIVTIANDLPDFGDYRPTSGAQVQCWLIRRRLTSYIIVDCYTDYYLDQAERLWAMPFGMPLTEEAVTTLANKLQEEIIEDFS